MFHLANRKVGFGEAVWLSLCLTVDPDLRREYLACRRLVQDLKQLQSTTPERKPDGSKNVVQPKTTISIGGRTMTHRGFVFAYTGLILAVSGTFLLKPGQFIAGYGQDTPAQEVTKDKDTITETIHIKNRLPIDVEKSIKEGGLFPTTLVEMVSDMGKKVIVLVGNPPEVARVKKLIEAADIPMKAVAVQMRLVRVAFDAKGVRTESTLMSPKIMTANDVEGIISISQTDKTGVVEGWNIKVKPHLESLNTVQLHVDIEKRGKTVRTSSCTQHVTMGKPTWFTGLVEKGDEEYKAPAVLGKMPIKTKNFVGYFLEVNATDKIDHPTTP